MVIKDIVFVYQMKDEKEIAWHGRRHSHPGGEYEVHYFLQGEGSFSNGTRTIAIAPGTAFVTTPGTEHAIRSLGAKSPVTYYAVLFAPEAGDGELDALLAEAAAGKSYHVGSNYRFFFEELREKGLSPDLRLRRSAVHQFISFLYLLDRGEGAFHYGDERNTHIERALRIMQRSVCKDLDLGALAGQLGLSDSYFIRLFREKMRVAPMKYLTRLRIEAASSMLSSTSLPLYAIAERLKFYNEFHLSKAFRQYTGMSPSQYRKQYHRELGEAAGEQ